MPKAKTITPNFGNIKPYSPPQEEKKPEKSTWRNFTFCGKIPSMVDLKNLNDVIGTEVFVATFKSIYHVETIKMNEKGEFLPVYQTYRITFNCTDTEREAIERFFLEKGFQVDVSLVNFNSRK